MKTRFTFCLLLVIYNLVCLYVFPCPIPCKCTHHSVDCRHQALKDVPKGISIDVTILDLSFNLIKSLSNNSFQTLINLKRLKLSHNEMKEINENAFVGLSNLRNLHLENNDLSVLHPETFNKGLIKLLHVYLGNNEFEKIPVLKATHMTKLNLDSNKIRSAVVDKSFLLNTGLQTLILTKNEIKEINQTDFINLKNTKLTTLTLKMNSLENIAAEAFVPVKNSLINLELEGNKLLNSTIVEQALTGFNGATGFQFLDLKSCGLTSISGDFLKPFFDSKLHHLDLSENSMLKSIDNDAFRGLDNLQILNLAKCKISDPDIRFSAMAKLTHLFMNDNNLINCPHRLPASLKFLHLQSNNIRQIRQDDFKSLTNLKELHLKKNSILSIETNSFDDLASLTSLDLGFNRLTRIESGIFHRMPKLISLNLEQQNPVLLTIAPNSFVLSNLESIELQGNRIKFDATAGPIFDKLPKLVNLSMRDNQITKLNENLFSGSVNIQLIDLSMNSLIGWPAKTFLPLISSAIDIRLNMNKLSTISIDFNSTNYLPIDFAKLKNISLENNQWNCSCHQIQWLLHFRKLILNRDQILCNIPNEKAGKNLFLVMVNCSDVILSRILSHVEQKSKVKSIVISFVVVIIIVVILVLICRHRKRLKFCKRMSSPSYDILHNSSFENTLVEDINNNNDTRGNFNGSLCLKDYENEPYCEINSKKEPIYDLELDFDVLYVTDNVNDRDFVRLTVKFVNELTELKVKMQILHCEVLAIDYRFKEMENLKEILKERGKKKKNFFLYESAICEEELINEMKLYCDCRIFDSDINQMFYDLID